MAGRTVGKAALGLRVVTVEGAPVRFRHAAIRAALRIVDFFLIPSASSPWCSALLGRDDQRARRPGRRHAGAAGAHGARDAAPPWRSRRRPGYEAYVAALDVTALDAGPVRGPAVVPAPASTELTPAARAATWPCRLRRPVAAATSATRRRADGVHPEHLPRLRVAAAYQRRHGGPAARTLGPSR